MEMCREHAHDAIGAMTNHGLTWLGTPLLERRIAIAFARKIPLPGEESIASVVHGLRIVGVWVCATDGTDLITDCPCFVAIAKDETEGALQELLTEKLDRLTGGATA
jgi:hypothetical protein